MGLETTKGGLNASLNCANNTIRNHSNCTIKQRYNYIPLDFLKGKIIGLEHDYFLKNESLHFTPILHKENSGEIKFYFVEYCNMILKVYPNKGIYISGSLHKLYNEGLHNYNQFNESALNRALELLNEVFGIKPKNIRILCLEYGVNITPPIQSNLIIDNLMQHKCKDFEQKISNDKGKYSQCEHSDYIIKIYNKGKQYSLDENLLRIEIKQTNWSTYRLKNRIVTLQDFIECDKTIFIQNLISKWNEIVFYDPTNKGVEKWSKYSNVNFWRDIKGYSGTTIKKHRDRLRELNSNNGVDVQKLVSIEILQNIEKLQGVKNFKFNESKLCLVTGIDISMQKDNSKLLSHSGLRYLKETNSKAYESIKNVFLTDKWRNSKEYIQIKETAHNIRTVYRNKLSTFSPLQIRLF